MEPQTLAPTGDATTAVTAAPKDIKEAKKTPPLPKKLSQTALGEMYQNLVLGLREFFKKNTIHRAVVGVSGGIDSALTLKIAVDALGGDNVTGIIMPELGVTRQENIDHAKMLCQFFGARYFYQPINPFLPDFFTTPWRPTEAAQGNTKARVRCVLLYSYANSANALVVGTSNKSEILLGYGTKFGDLAADVEAIGELLKTEVFAVAEYIGMPKELLTKAPSAELVAGQTDEEELGARYVDMDRVLAHADKGMEACIEMGFPHSLVSMIFRRMEQNEHKRHMPPVISLHK
ncbi:NAD+ synthase [Candidatus Gracilibacteria bacterium]|nr:NAD+ synthase [Candidatus Gracilibacteria bacterium]